VVGELAPVTANIFKEGHDVLAARALLRRGDEVVGTCPLTATGNDEWAGAIRPPAPGAYEVVIEAWTDRYATWAHKAAIKLAAREDVTTELAEAVLLLSEAPSDGKSPDGSEDGEDQLANALAALNNGELDDASRINLALSAPVAHARAGPSFAKDLTTSPPLPLWVERERAAVGAWYELFPRSFGGLRGAAAQVPRLAELGFDVLYVPPVHPIGHSFRKGKNNSLVPEPGDPGSPWAIGAEEGGYTTLHPEIGTFADFDFLVQTLKQHGMELAMDYALNASPDHPWVRDHPEWFHHRPDGSIAYAENPPKKYQDIYPLNFWPPDEADRVALWDACKEIIDFWCQRGVRIYRVDNPHTKPFAFWEWLVKALREDWPDVVLLAEAFTRPKIMARLAEVGFSQSYTYFAWRVTQYGPEGIRTYMDELAHTGLADYMRPNFWPNTPDILSGPLRGGPPAAFALRYVLAATLSPAYGVYSGYELCENVPASAANEEYLNSEKFEIKHRDYSRPGSLAPLFGAVNAIRRRHSAFKSLRTVHFVGSDNPNIIAYSKTADDGGDPVIVVVTLDPYGTQETTLHLDMPFLVEHAATWLEVHDELSGETYSWGLHPYVRFDPWRRVAHILAVRAYL
jgi:starch synthase (maltosyl-transferring)